MVDFSFFGAFLWDRLCDSLRPMYLARFSSAEKYPQTCARIFQSKIFMYPWPYSTRGARERETPKEPQNLPPFKLFETNDTSMKVWLPQVLSERVGWLSQVHDQSTPDVIRALMFANIYGEVALKAMTVYVNQRRSEAVVDAARNRAKGHLDDILRSTDRATNLEYLGKATDNLRVELPSRMKQDIAAVASIHGINSSSYVRKALVQKLLGEQLHTKWQQALGKMPTMRELADLESDER